MSKQSMSDGSNSPGDMCSNVCTLAESDPGNLKAPAAEFAGWDDPVLETIDALDRTFRWGVYDRQAF